MTEDEEAYASALAHHRAGRLGQAFALCRTLSERAPEHAGAAHLAGVIAHQIGRSDIAEDLIRGAIELAPEAADAHDTLGVVLIARGEPDQALASCRRAVELAPDQPRFLCNLGLALRHLNRHDEAVAVFRRALALDPASAIAPTQSGLAQALYPGDDYLAVLGALHRHLEPAAYIEIGIRAGASLRLAGPSTRCVGIDPAPAVEGVPFRAPTRVFALTSDAYFAERDPRRDLGDRSFDLAFIDGLHSFDQALRDFANLERHGAATSVVVFHDVLPADALTASRDCRSALWAGDTWKVVPILRRYRPDLRLLLIPTAPTGLAVVTHLDPTSTVLIDAADEITAAHAPLTYQDYQRQEPERRPSLVANQWPAIAERLDAHRSSR